MPGSRHAAVMRVLTNLLQTDLNHDCPLPFRTTSSIRRVGQSSIAAVPATDWLRSNWFPVRYRPPGGYSRSMMSLSPSFVSNVAM